MAQREWTLRAVCDERGQVRMDAMGNFSPAEVVFVLETIKMKVLSGDTKPMQGGVMGGMPGFSPRSIGP